MLPPQLQQLSFPLAAASSVAPAPAPPASALPLATSPRHFILGSESPEPGALYRTAYPRCDSLWRLSSALRLLIRARHFLNKKEQTNLGANFNSTVSPPENQAFNYYPCNSCRCSALRRCRGMFLRPANVPYTNLRAQYLALIRQRLRSQHTHHYCCSLAYDWLCLLSKYLQVSKRSQKAFRQLNCSNRSG